jgi:Uma2 family endonuclease
MIQEYQTILEDAVDVQRFAMRYEEYLTRFDDRTRTEWVNGEVIVSMPPFTQHQRIVTFLINLIALYVDFFKLGELLTAPFEMRHLPGFASREPDILFVAQENLHRLDEQRLEGPADLVIEVISRGTAHIDRVEKLREYEQSGVPEYWLLDPRPRQQRARFYQHTPSGSYQEAVLDHSGRYHSAVLAGFWLQPEWLWQQPLPDPLTTAATIAPQIRHDPALQQALATTRQELRELREQLAAVVVDQQELRELREQLAALQAENRRLRGETGE